MRKMSILLFLIPLWGCGTPPPPPPLPGSLSGQIVPKQTPPYKCNCSPSPAQFTLGGDGHYRGVFDMGNGATLGLEFYEENPNEWRVFASGCAGAELSSLTKGTRNPKLTLTITNAGNQTCCGGNFGMFNIVISE